MEKNSDEKYLELYLSNDLNKKIYLSIDKVSKWTISGSLDFFNTLFRVLDVIDFYEWTWISKWNYIKNYLAQFEPDYQKLIVFFVKMIAIDRLDTSKNETITLIELIENLDYSKNSNCDKDLIESSKIISYDINKAMEGYAKVRGLLKSQDQIVKDFVIKNEDKIRKLIIPEKTINSNEELLNIIEEYIDNFVKHDIEQDGGYRYLWKDELPLGEIDTQPFIKILLNKYCEDSEIKIIRENKTGNGNVDFTFSDGKNTICLEVKNAHHKRADTAISSQLPKYMKGEKTNCGIYLVLWFKSIEGFPLPTNFKTILDLKKSVENSVPNELNIRTIIIDCSKPELPSKQ